MVVLKNDSGPAKFSNRRRLAWWGSLVFIVGNGAALRKLCRCSGRPRATRSWSRLAAGRVNFAVVHKVSAPSMTLRRPYISHLAPRRYRACNKRALPRSMPFLPGLSKLSTTLCLPTFSGRFSKTVSIACNQAVFSHSVGMGFRRVPVISA